MPGKKAQGLTVAGAYKFPVWSRTVIGTSRASCMLGLLVHRSCWFAFTPLPDDEYQITVKTDVSHILDHIYVQTA